jgi:LPS export ABC transporter permease LptG
MAKNNELVAFKAAGISLYRVALPLILAGGMFAIGLMIFDSTYLPYANQRQDALRNQIKGRAAQTYYQPQRQWIIGNDAKVYNYQLFDRDQNLFGGLSVLELDAATFAVRRRVYANRASWDAGRAAWVLESGWVRDFRKNDITRYLPFSELELPEINEPPSYFSREVRQSYQMDWWELRQYIADLRQAGFDVARLSVQLHKKLAFPLIAPIIVLLAVPFAVIGGRRGAVGGLAMGLLVSFGYRGVAALFEAMGAVGQLPPVLAAWSPDVIFAFLGVYFFLNMQT